ncbi:MAG: PAS domain-containing protein [Alphaproteobacteria bacterium]
MPLAPLIVFGFSLAFQLTAAVLAIRLIRITNKHLALAWTIVAIAMALMGVRRMMTAYDILILGEQNMFDLDGELVALGISLLMATSMALIGPFFESLRREQNKIQDAQIALAEAQRVAHIGSWERNPRTEEVWWSDEHYRIYGYEPGEIAPSYFAFLNGVHPDDRDMIRRMVDAAHGGQECYDAEYRIVRPDGCIRVVHSQGGMVHDEKGLPLRMRGTIQDITERRQTADKTRKSEQHFRALIENALDMIILLGDDSAIQFVSPSVGRIMGYAPADLCGKNVFDFVHPEDNTLMAEVSKRTLESANRVEQVELRFRHNDGSWHVLDAILRNLLDDPAVCAVVVNARDVTERVTMEAQLRQSQKMEVVGQLTGGIAHDFNNLLAVILGNLEVIEERVAADPATRALVRPAVNAAERGALLTERLLAFSRKQALRPQTVNLKDTVTGMTEILRRTLGAGIAIETICGAGLWSCDADPGQLENAILNLAINARDAMPNGGQLTIEISNARLDDDYAAAQADVLPGHYVVISISDTGVGMPPEILRHVFEPFYTTKEVGRGTGLGLSMVYGFVKQSGGHVTIYSEPDKGTTVRLYFPRVRHSATAARPDDSSQPNYFARGETILVVEDDPDVRSLAVTLLGDLGYKVLEAGNGKSALDLLNENSHVNLLLSDIVLPGGMGGNALAAEARKISPGLRVVFMSGYTEKAVVRHGQIDASEMMLQKPFRRAELARKLRQALDLDHVA